MMFAIGLDNAKNSINVGHVLRACHAYGGSMVAVSGTRDIKSCTDVSAAYRHVPTLRANDLHTVIPFGCIPVAVELHDRAESLITFNHPANAYYVFGPEDGTLGDRVLSWCKHVVYVPTTICMNLSACVNTVLYDRMAKEAKTDV